MFFLSLTRILNFSTQNFIRNIWLSVVTITIIVLTLFSVTSLLLLNAITDQAVRVVKSKIDVSVYFKPSVTPEQIQVVEANLESLAYVKAVKYVSKSEALEKLRARYSDSPLILESLKELQANPLGDTLIVSTHETADYQKVIDILNATPQYAVLIDNKNFEDNRFIIDRLESLAKQVNRAGWTITVFFAAVAVLVIVNTIRIAVYTHRDEVAIMKLVGASNAFVRGPFIVETIFYAIIGTLLTIGLSYLAVNLTDPYISALLGSADFSLRSYLNAQFLPIFGWELLGISLVAITATAIALRRYLKV